MTPGGGWAGPGGTSGAGKGPREPAGGSSTGLKVSWRAGGGDAAGGVTGGAGTAVLRIPC